MKTADAIRKAAQLFAEWKDGDIFEVRRFPTQDVWFECKPDEVFSWIADHIDVRLKPAPKKVLRKVVEIFTDAAKRGLLSYQTVDGEGILYASGWGLTAIDGKEPWSDASFPDYFYTTYPGDIGDDRIERVADAIVDRYYDDLDGVILRDIITDELKKGGF